MAGDGALTAICLPAPEAAAAILAAWDAGRAVLPLDPRAPGPERRRVLAATRPTFLLDAAGRHRLPDSEAVADGVAAVVATSGTTGGPKGVELTVDGLRASAAAVTAGVGAGDDDRWLCCLPLSAVGGLAIVARAWSTGLPLEVVSRFDTATVAATPATLVSLVPTTLRRCLDAGLDLGRFTAVLVGGAALDPALRIRAEEAGAPVVTTYGMTETWGGLVHDGHPLAGAEVRLGEESEILVRGPMVMRAYRLRPEETTAAFVVGPDRRLWLRTGDAGAWDPAGALVVVDRLRDLVLTGGVNVSATEVESVLGTHPGVADVAVAGAPDPEWGQVVVAHVVAADPARPPTLAELRTFAAERLSAAKLPRRLELVDRVPRTPGGKPVRRLLGSGR
ncbi:MAG: class I adenylate-forming enzyme family protein [Acidimicrobiales bacterium]